MLLRKVAPAFDDWNVKGYVMSYFVTRSMVPLACKVLAVFAVSCGAASGQVDMGQTGGGNKSGTGSGGSGFDVNFGQKGQGAQRGQGDITGGGLGGNGVAVDGASCGQLVATIRDFSDQHPPRLRKPPPTTRE